MEDSPLKELNEMEVTKLSGIEFKIILIRMLKELTDSMKKETETINKNQEEMKNTISEIKKKHTGRNYMHAG